MGGTLLSYGAGSLRTEPPRDPLAAAAEVAAAVAALHRDGRVHGRLHAGNVLRAGAGLFLREVPAPAATLPAAAADLAALGCAAPEVLRGRPATRASDVHALAVMVADLLAGRSAAAPASLAEAVQRGLRRPPLALGLAVPTAVARLLRRATSRRPWLRPGAAKLAQALAAASRAREERRAPPLAPPARPPPPPPQRGSRRPPRETGPVPVPPPAPRRPLLASVPPLRLERLRALRLDRLRAHPRPLAAIAAAALLLGAGAVALARRAGALERDVSARLAARDVDGARRLLREAERGGASGPALQKLRGDVACAARAYGDCLRRYEAALAASPSLGRDPRLRQNALALAARGDERRAVVAVLARLPGADGELLAMTRSPRYWTRWNAVRALEARGARERIDLARVYALDLLHAGSCDTRRDAAERLRDLRDPRVLPELTQADEAARSSWSAWRCDGPEVEEALRAARLARGTAR